MQLMSVIHSATELVYGEDNRTRKMHFWTIKFKSAIDNNDLLEFNSLLAGLIEKIIEIAQDKPFNNTHELQLTRILADYQKFSTYGKLSDCFLDFHLIAIANYDNYMYDVDDESDIVYEFDTQNRKPAVDETTEYEEPVAGEEEAIIDEFDFSEIEVNEDPTTAIEQETLETETLEHHKKKLNQK